MYASWYLHQDFITILGNSDERRFSPMRKRNEQILKQFFYEQLIQTRYEKRMTQTQMAGRLSMDPRSYVELDQGKSSCSALTLALFLIYVCKDSDTFLEKLRIALEGDDHAA